MMRRDFGPRLAPLFGLGPLCLASPKAAMDIHTRHDFLVMAIAAAVTLATVVVATIALIGQLH